MVIYKQKRYKDIDANVHTLSTVTNDKTLLTLEVTDYGDSSKPDHTIQFVKNSIEYTWDGDLFIPDLISTLVSNTPELWDQLQLKYFNDMDDQQSFDGDFQWVLDNKEHFLNLFTDERLPEKYRLIVNKN